MADQPPPLDYCTPEPPKPSNDNEAIAGIKLMGGLILGSGVSAWIWLGDLQIVRSPDGMMGGFFILLAAKFLIGMALLGAKSTRAVGIGLLISLPIGGFMFLSHCGQMFR